MHLNEVHAHEVDEQFGVGNMVVGVDGEEEHYDDEGEAWDVCTDLHKFDNLLKLIFIVH